MRFHSPALVTGASGFVGSHLAEALSAQKVKVKLLVRRTSLLPFRPDRRMELCYGDVTDAPSVHRAVQGVKAVYHLAGILRGSDPKKLEAVNAEGTRNVCEAAASVKGLGRFVYVGSLSAAGPSPDGKPIRESDPCRPVSLYGRTKWLGEEIARSYRKKFPLTILRPAAVYGPRETDIFSYFKMVRSGLLLVPSLRQEVSFIHVADLVFAILKAAHSRRAVGETYFVCDGRPIDWQGLAEVIAEALGRKFWTLKVPMPIVRLVALLGEVGEKLTGKASMLNLDKVQEAYHPAWVCSDLKIRRHLGFRPHYDIREGVRNTLRFYLSQGWLKP